MSLECLCVKNSSSSPNATGGILRAKISCSPACIRVVPTAVGSIIANGRRERGVSATLSSTSKISSKASATLRLGGVVTREDPAGIVDYVGLLDADQELLYTIPDYATHFGKKHTQHGIFTVFPGLRVQYALRSKQEASGSMSVSYTDKFSGDFNDFGCYQKLYPTSDVTTELNGSYFVDENLDTSNIYDSIDEGVFTGNYHTNDKTSRRIVDDRSTYIQPSAIYTDGNFRYKCGVTTPSVTPHESRLYIRASAPRANYGSDTPPKYVLNNIKLLDPSGNTIIHYNDIVLRGDADYENVDDVNFSTYGSSPKINNTLKNDWHTEYPFMQGSTGFTLNIDLKVEALDDPFDRGFNVGYDDQNELYVSSATNQDYLALDGSPLSTRIQNFSLNPTNTIRISAIEICNSGAYDTAVEHYLPIHLGVEATGRRIERCILPSMMPTYGFSSGIYPAVSSIWYDQSLQHSNQSGVGAGVLTGALRSNHLDRYITMSGTSTAIPDSGKLFLKFSHNPPSETFDYLGGEFDIGHSSNEFSVARGTTYTPVDNFFMVDSVSLKVRARKEAGSRDYALDVVGWSDDKLLHVTPAVGGFLQNASGYGTIPTTSGFNSTDELAVDGESISDQDQYFSTNLTNNAGGDHYLLDLPKVTGTSFEWYDIPLTVYEDRDTLGKYKDYSNSSYFENLYVDIYPIPSGASIASVQLCVKYKPTNALQLHILGANEIRRIAKDRGEGKLYPTVRQNSEDIINAGSGYAALSTIENIPHAYKTPSGIKSNYSRRWRGLEGVVSGPFDPDMFGFGFENPLLDFPFLSGYYDFDYDDGLTIKSRPLGSTFGGLDGTMTPPYTDHHLKNIGWRFNSSGVFANQLPGYSSPYRTTDWTALSNGSANFRDHELYGNIADAFNNVIRISGQNSNVNFGHIDTASGFSVYVRFTPDANISGVDYNLFDSGVLVSKWDTGNDLEFALGYDKGYLCGYAQDKDNNIIKVTDTVSYSGYQYPLSALLTYNDKDASGLKLYTDNELHSGDFNVLRASSSAFYKKPGSSNVVLGYSSGSGVGMNMFVSEFALGTYHESGAHIVEANPDLTFKEITAESFLAGNRVKFWASGEPSSNDRYKLWDYINEDTLQWDLGAFKTCEFSVDFDWFTTRVGRDLIHHNLKHDGSGYSARTNMELPSSVRHSDVSYHSQIENDFLRFNLSDASDNFHSASPRISKTVPRGYKFSDRALVVETVLEHDTYNDIVWSDGSVGPKLIVSLYTKNQEPASYTTENWGLVNRAIHYLKPSGCWRRVDSTFTHDSMFDESEPWALFPNERRFTEFDHKYYSQDINDMFLQYDLVYPSGPAFESRINIHSAHVRLEDAFVSQTANSGQMNLTASGEKRERENLSLYSTGLSGVNNLWGPGVSGLSLFTSFSPTYRSGVMPLHTSGNIPASGFYLPLWVQKGPYSVDTAWNPSGMSFYTSGAYRVDTYGDGLTSLPLFLHQTGILNIPSGGNIPLHLQGCNLGTNGLYRHMPLFLYNSLYSRIPGLRDNLPSGMVLHTLGRQALSSNFSYANNMSLFVKTGGLFAKEMPLVVYGEDNIGLQKTQSLQLHTINFHTGAGATVGSDFMRWDGYSFGKKIEVDDNIYASITADNEIRGVELICYGACDASGDAGGRCNDKAIYTHDTLWRPQTCNDGGIFRAHATYTNIVASGFGPSWYGAGISPSANYYGIRKYDGLVPGGAYDVTIRGRTGTSNHISLPPEWEEWEYGSTDTINFSGVKLIGDYPYLSGQRELSAISGRIVGDEYGKDVSVKGDLMVVGSPHHQFDERGGSTFLNSGTTAFSHLVWRDASGLNNAGATFVYRRDTEANGEKSAWQLETKLVLPSAFRADYFLKSPGNVSFGGLPAIPVRKWKVGQEGRELGHSVDLSVSTKSKSLYEDSRQIIVAGAPGASWLRTFDSTETSGVKVAVMVFTDEFRYTGANGETIANKIEEQNWIYKYYSKAINADNDTVHLELDVIVCQPTGIFGNQNTAAQEELAKFLHHKKIGRKYGATDLEIYSGIKDAFLDVYPYDNTKIHSGIPPVVGMYVDDSRSLGRGDLEPAIDMFKDFYRDYSRSSGVKDFNGVVSTGHMYELYPSNGAAEDWVGMSTKLIGELVDTGRLIRDDGLRFITGGIGLEYANPELTEFNIPPASGGRVYIFEKESGSWNLIQEIITSNENQTTFSDKALASFEIAEDYYADDDDPMAGNKSAHKYDRFGHSVAISDNGEVITIGSPYMEDCCLVYEHDSSEKTRMYNGLKDWLTSKNSDARFNSLLEKLDRFTIPHGSLTASKMIYAELTPSEKFDFRSDEIYWSNDTIKEYKRIYQYGYGNIPYQGTWQFIPSIFAGTSRLGYSTTVSEDGNIVAFGAPTDSFNEWDDTNVWYKDYNTWASYVNAGAVRLFESRNYHPHSGVVEFTKFGNLDRSINFNQYPERYDDLKMTFLNTSTLEGEGQQASGSQARAGAIPFARTSFADVEVPTMAGTAFIITPEIDAASDEIIENIKDWMALGDRTLVLVGNDPVWEDNGRYEQSNEIINKILSKLDSRMRLHPARNKYESLADCTPSGRPNVLRSFVPWGSRGTDFQINSPIYAKGVADIRMHMPTEWPDIVHSPCDDLNTKCEIPLRHDGDLRAEWSSECAYGQPECNQVWSYKTNWPWHFASTPNYCLECNEDSREIKKPYEEPSPLMVAAEYLPPSWTVYPAYSTTSGGDDIFEKVYVPPGPNTITYSFADRSIDNVEFGWSGDGGVYNTLSMGNFFNPEPVSVTDNNGNSISRDSVLQAKGGLKESSEIVYEEKDVSVDSIFAAEEKWGNTTSKVVIIAGLTPESEEMLSLRYDYNISFYENLVMPNCVNTASILQLGGWTNKESFKDAYSDSLLQELFFFKGHDVIENWTGDLPDTFNVCWIANPHGTPDADDLRRIKSWLDTGDKTLVITYPNMTVPVDGFDQQSSWTLPDQAIARNTYVICSGLGINTKPLYLEGKGRFASRRTDSTRHGTELTLNSGIDPRNTADWNSKIIKGCEEKERVKEFYIDGDSVNSEFPEFIPLDIGSGVGYSANRIIHINDGVKDIFPVTNDTSYWQIKSSIAGLNVPVTPMSGYRLFYSWVSELPDEDHDIKMNLSKVYAPSCGTSTSCNPYPGNDKSNQPDKYKLYDYDTNDVAVLHASDITFTKSLKGVFGTVNNAHMDIWVPSGVTNFDFYFDANDLRVDLTKDHPGQPITTRLLSVSGCLLPITETVHIKEGTWINKKVGETPIVTTNHPATSSVVPEIFRPIMTDNTKYCNPDSDAACSDRGGKLIADGPMVIAEEPEHFTAFPAGQKRSKIVLISDASIVQGDCHWYREEKNSANQGEPNRIFIRSLYTPLGAVGSKGGMGTSNSMTGLQLNDVSTLQNTDGGRQFSHSAKLLAPDRGSPAKYFAASGLEGLRQRFNGPAYGTSFSLDLYDDDENIIDPRTANRPADPETEEQKKAAIEAFRSSVIPTYGTFPCFSGTIEGKEYGDAGLGGGIPAIMNDTGSDYLDFDRFPSGYPGDLFGFSISLHSGKLVVGAPFNGFSGSGIHDWDDIKLTSSPVSGIHVSNYGGAGAAYGFERTGKGSGLFGEYLPWSFMQKLKPSGANVGHDNLDAVSSQDHFVLGPNEYQGSSPNDDFGQSLPITDRFGYDVSVHGDFVAIGAPGHDFENYHEHIFDRVKDGVVYSGAFLRKEFDLEFDIPLHNTYDLSTSGIRGTMPNSGLTVVNNGAVFTFQHKIVDWDNRTKEWTYAEKLVPQGHNARKQKEYSSGGGIVYLSASGTENDHFGSTVDINRARRGDGDYTMVVGAPHHIFATSGEHPDSNVRLYNAGAAYTYDAMLRHQPPALASPDNWIIANLFGDTPSGIEPINLSVTQNSEGGQIDYETTGTVWANEDGEIFLEASGFDPVKKGFIENRCYIDLVYGQLRVGPQITSDLPLSIDGNPLSSSGSMPLTMRGPSSAYVYNSMSLYTPGVLAVSGINVPSGLVMYMHSPDPVACSGIGFPTGSGLLFTVSGTHTPSEELSLRIRGK